MLPAHDQVQGPDQATDEAVPVVQRLVVGVEVPVVLCADPQTPLITGVGGVMIELVVPHMVAGSCIRMICPASSTESHLQLVFHHVYGVDSVLLSSLSCMLVVPLVMLAILFGVPIIYPDPSRYVSPLTSRVDCGTRVLIPTD